MSSKKNTGYVALVALGAVGAGFLFYKADSFWGVVASALICVLTLVTMIPVMDGLWRFKTGFVFCTLLLGLLILWPTLEGATGGKLKCPTYVKDHMSFGIAEGLDLQGGMRLVYTVEVEEAIRDKRDHFADDMRQDLATAFQIHSGEGLLSRDESAKLDAKVHISMPESAVVRLKFHDAADTAKVDERFEKKYTNELSELRGPGEGEVTFKIRSEVESGIRERAVNQAKDTVNRRVDELGLREASVTTRDEDIIVEVPGDNEKDFNRTKEIIRRTARLEFKMVDDPVDFIGRLKNEDLPEGEGISIDNPERAPDGPGKNIESHYAKIICRQQDSVTKKENGESVTVKAETIEQCHDRFKKWASTLQVPDDHQLGFEKVHEFDPDTGKSNDIGWRTFYLFSRAEVTGDYITEASVAQDNQSGAGVGNFYVAITFSPAGADRFEEVTGANVQRRFAIILDDEIDSAPVIKTKIGGGRASITMGAGDPEQQLQQARQLELVLRSGALPAPISPSNESLIGPSLGKDAIAQGVRGMIVGSSLVLLFMMAYYRKSGVVADVAVLFNLLLQMAILASAGATMTLPGIAGLALTIGMSVDANVLINERIREELRAGRSIRAAVEAGYEKAFPSILDGHVTVFITGLICWQYGTGPVKGFAVTLIVGIVASLYTGVFCTRLVFDWWVRHAKVKRLSVGAEF